MRCTGSSHEKTMLLFVIRDHVGSTPLKNLMETLTQDMEKIWASLSKVRTSSGSKKASNVAITVYLSHVHRSRTTSHRPAYRTTLTSLLRHCHTRSSSRKSLKRQSSTCARGLRTARGRITCSSLFITNVYRQMELRSTWRVFGCVPCLFDRWMYADSVFSTLRSSKKS